MDNNYAPYSFQSDEGKLQGILIDQWYEWEKKTGIKVDIHAMDWCEALRLMRADEFDVIDCIVETTDRKSYFDFTPAYTTVGASIYFRSDISGITDLSSLKGFPIGVKTGDQHIDKLKAKGATNLILFENNNAIIQAAREKKINVFLIDNPSALHLLNKMGIASEFRHSATIFEDKLRRAVRHGDNAMLDIVSSGFKTIESDKLKQIDEKWFGQTIHEYGRYFTYAGYALVVVVVVIATLVGWNRMLRKAVQLRTAALGESELRLRQITENIREVFWMATPAMGDILYVSPAYEYTWGRSLESLYQQPQSFYEAIHLEDRKRAIAMLKEQQEHGFDIEYRIVRPDGTVRWIRHRGFPVKAESGKVYRVAGVSEDITESKHAKDTLQKSEDRIRLIINTIPTMAWTIRPDGTVDFVNQRWLDYAGHSWEEIEEPARIVHPEDLSRVLENWIENMASGKSYEEELRLKGADGEYRWFLVRTAPLHDEKGNVVKWYGVSIDIDESKRLGNALQESEQYYLSLFENMAEGVAYFQMIFIDGTLQDAIYLEVNPAWEKMTGLTNVVGKRITQVLPGILDSNSEFFERSVRVALTGQTERFETYSAALKKWLSVSAYCPKKEHVIVVFDDITERKQADDKLQLAYQRLSYHVENTPLAVVEFDKDLVIKRWSKRAEEIFGWTAPEALGKNVHDTDFQIIYRDDLSAVDTINEALTKGTVNWNISLNRNYTKDGSVIYNEWYNSVLRDEHGNVITILSLVHNVTQRKKTEEKLQQVNAELHRLSSHLQSIQENERTAIAREIHDELGQLLTGLKMEIGWLNKKLPDDTVLQAKGNEILSLVGEMLKTVKRIAMDLRPNMLDELGLMAAIEWQGQEFEKSKGIKFKFHTNLNDFSPKKNLSTNVFRVHQEALTNIARHAQATQIETTLERNDGSLLLVIKDNGNGFNVDEEKSIRSIGLIGMKERALMLQGELTIESEKGKGTVVMLKVPIA
jgi:PAS domain S-box-containing protein